MAFGKDVWVAAILASDFSAWHAIRELQLEFILAFCDERMPSGHTISNGNFGDMLMEPYFPTQPPSGQPPESRSDREDKSGDRARYSEPATQPPSRGVSDEIAQLSCRAKPLLNELLKARGPSGNESEVRTICHRILQDICDECFTDPAGNVIGIFRGTRRGGSPMRIFAHMDELSLIVKRIDEKGRLMVRPQGGIFPGNVGQGPVDIIGLSGKIVPGVLSFGSMHTTAESSKAWALNKYGENRSPDWSHVHIETRRSLEELGSMRVTTGAKVVISSSRRELLELGDCWGGFFMDNRAPLAAMLLTAQQLSARRDKLVGDCYIVATASEETGAQGAAYASRVLPDGVTIAVDVGPVAEEYGTELTANPIVVFKDNYALYNQDLSTEIIDIGESEGLKLQPVVFETYGSDASISSQLGHASRSGLVCIPTLNTHGYELVHRYGVGALAKLLTELATKRT